MQVQCLALAWMLASGTVSPALGAPDLDSQDPVQWAVHRLQETPEGPKLKLWEPKGPEPKVARNADGSVRDPRRVFPDEGESSAVMRAVDELMALGRRAPLDDKQRAFGAVARAAERWARVWAPSIPEGLDHREARKWVKALGERMIANPAVPRFNELVDPSMDPAVAAETSFNRGWRDKRGEAAWRLGPREDAPLSVAYNSAAHNSLDFEITRLHEWVHVVDEARLGEVDGEGRLVKTLSADRAGLFTEAKSYAIDYLLQRAFLSGSESSLGDAAEELGIEPLEASFEQYLAYELLSGGIYPWASGMKLQDPATLREERADAKRFDLKERKRAKRCPKMKYVRTLAP